MNNMTYHQRISVDFENIVCHYSYPGSSILFSHAQEEEDMKSPESDGETQTKYIKITNTIQIPETESVRLIVEMLQVIWEAILTGLTRGFMPTVERVRRDTASHKGSTS